MQHSPAPRVQTAYNESVRPRKEHEMSIPKLCLRLAVFLCTLTVALFVTRLFLIPPRVEVRVAAPALPSAVVAASEPAKVNFKVLQVVSDFTHKKTYVQLLVERDPHAPAPEYLG